MFVIIVHFNELSVMFLNKWKSDSLEKYQISKYQ